MAKAPPPTYTGPLKADLTALLGILVDLPPGGTQRTRREKEGIKGVIEELASAMPKHGGAAGITTELYDRFTACNKDLDQIRDARGLVDKLAEVLRESEAHHEDTREGFLSMMCKSIKSAAQHDNPTIVAPFEKTLKYNAQSAEKAVKTRRKNAKGEEGEEAEGDEEAKGDEEAEETEAREADAEAKPE